MDRFKKRIIVTSLHQCSKDGNSFLLCRKTGRQILVGRSMHRIYKAARMWVFKRYN